MVVSQSYQDFMNEKQFSETGCKEWMIVVELLPKDSQDISSELYTYTPS